MRVGILTFHYVSNYGAVLQAYGLQAALEEIGHEPVFLNYIPSYMRKHVSALRGWGFGSGFGFFTKFRQRLHEHKRRRGFAEFRRARLKCSVRLSTKQELARYCSRLDAVIVGSDQVWNLRWHNTFDDTYFLGFLPNKGCKVRRIAYAPCFGDPDQPVELLAQAQPLIERFNAVGMRTQFGLDLVSGIKKRSAKRVVDPAFFLPRKEINKGMSKGVIVYTINASTSKPCAEIAHSASILLKQQITQLAAEIPVHLPIRDLELLRYTRPEEWMQIVTKSAFVCSESFHGVVFAMANEVPFVASSSGLRAHRVRDLLRHYGLEWRLIENMSFDNGIRFIEECCSPVGISERLTSDIVDSKKFLVEALA